MTLVSIAIKMVSIIAGTVVAAVGVDTVMATASFVLFITFIDICIIMIGQTFMHIGVTVHCTCIVKFNPNFRNFSMYSFKQKEYVGHGR